MSAVGIGYSERLCGAPEVTEIALNEKQSCSTRLSENVTDNEVPNSQGTLLATDELSHTQDFSSVHQGAPSIHDQRLAHQCRVWNAYAKYCAKLSTCQVPLCSPQQTEEEAFTARVLNLTEKPARAQINAEDFGPSAYTQGNQEFNIWYGKYLTDRYDRTNHDREPAQYRLNPEEDSGYTRANSDPSSPAKYICIFFARGCCVYGKDCHFHHRLPIPDDTFTVEASRDIFGRERHCSHRDDLGGVGSFNHECRTLFIGGLQQDRGELDPLLRLEEEVRRHFSSFGIIESIRVIPKKTLAFVTYRYRASAEFAKVAMADQCIGKYGQILNVRWAHNDGTTKEVLPQQAAEIHQQLEPVTNCAAMYDAQWQAYCSMQNAWLFDSASQGLDVKGQFIDNLVNCEETSNYIIHGRDVCAENVKRMDDILRRIDDVDDSAFEVTT